MSLIVVAIAIPMALFILWAALQPKQGSKASNAPEDTPNKFPEENITYQLPKPPIKAPQKAPPPSPEYIDPQDEATPDVNAQIRALMANYKKIEALKLIRATTGWGLKDAKAYLDKFPNVAPLVEPYLQSRQSLAVPADIDLHHVNEHIRQLLRHHRKIEAIKVYRQITGCDLRTAKDYVEALPPKTEE